MTSDRTWQRRASDDDSVHLLLIERDHANVPLIGEMVRASWSGAMTFTHAQRIDDANQQLLAGGVTAVLLGDTDDTTALEHVRLIAPTVPVVVLADTYSASAALIVIRAGAQDYVARSDLTPGMLRRVLVHAIERKRSEVQLAHRALQDPLTGLPNRTLFMDRLGMALDRARRTGSITGVLFLDVDGFKLINDSLGHAEGDRVLTALAGRMRSVLRPMDTVARFGGDEFTFLFEGLSSPQEAVTIAERIRHATSVPISLSHGQEELSVSIGVATTSDPNLAPEDLLAQADAAMYEAKDRERSEPRMIELHDAPLAVQEALAEEVDPEMDVEVLDRTVTRGSRGQLADQLRTALDRGELRVYYQPVYRFEHDRQVAGFEALVRWQHPERGLIPPAEFIPLAEELGLVGEIGNFVFDEALQLLSRLLEARGDLSVSINLSADQLGERGLAAAVAAVDASGVEPDAVTVEIPERTVSEDPDAAIHAADVLRAAGLKVAIDDYGTGSVPLSSLRRLKADELKIHGSIVGELDGGPADQAVVGAVVELGHALGMTVVAEGVETDTQLLGLRTLGCDGAQGFLLCRPMGPDQLEELIMHAS